MCSMVAQAQNVNDAGKVRIMSYNIRVGKGMDQVSDLERTASIINSQKPIDSDKSISSQKHIDSAKPIDSEKSISSQKSNITQKSLNREIPFVVALQEVDSVTVRTGSINQIEELGRLTGMYEVFAGALDYSGGRYGVGMLSTEKPLSIKKIALPGREESRVLLIVEFENFVAASTHFSLTEEDRIASAQILNREAMLVNKPMFVAGDFNAEPQSQTIKLINNHFTTLSNDSMATFPSNEPKVCIDYILGKNSESFSYKVLYSNVIPESMASDHRPIVVDVIIK